MRSASSLLSIEDGYIDDPALDDGVYASLKRDAKANHRSIEAEARYRLEHGGSGAIVPGGLANRFRNALVDPGPDYEGSVALVRAIRDEE